MIIPSLIFVSYCSPFGKEKNHLEEPHSSLPRIRSQNTALLGYHGVNVHGLESRGQLMVVHIKNPYEGMKAEELDSKMMSKRTFMG